MTILSISLLVTLTWTVQGFTAAPFSARQGPPKSISSSQLFLRTNIQLPILDVLDTQTGGKDDIIYPLPSSHLPDPVATPFLYGMQLDLPIHKLLLQEATESALTLTPNSIISDNDQGPPMYGHLVWKGGDSLVGAIGCTAQILVNAPTTEVFNEQLATDLDKDADSTEPSESSTPSETPPNTVLCRGGFRFVIKEVVKSIPYPVAIIDEIEDDCEVGDSDMFGKDFGGDFDEDDDDDDDDKYSDMSPPELIREIMQGVQSVINEKLEKVDSKQMSPLERSILEDSGVSVDPNLIEKMQIEEMAAAWDVFQSALIDDIEPQDRKYAIAIMATELADMKNEIRRQVLLTRDSDERLRIVLRELDETVGMARARKVATQITEESDESSRDLKVGAPTLPPWASTIRKGARVEYFWNEEYGWVAGEVIEEPMNVLNEILLTIRFDDGETHKLPLSADEKVRWRPG